MEISDALLQKIETYLSGKMPEEEQKVFAEEIGQNVELAMQVELFQQAKQAIELSAEKELKERLKTRYQKKPVRQLWGWPTLAVASTICLLIVAAIWFFRTDETNKLSPEEVFATYYSPDLVIAERGEPMQELENINEAYRTGDYAGVIQKITNIDPDSLGDRELYLYMILGSSYLATNQPQKAIETLEQIGEGSVYKWKAKWYKALAFIKQDELSQAKSLLEDLTESREFREDAKYILEQIGD